MKSVAITLASALLFAALVTRAQQPTQPQLKVDSSNRTLTVTRHRQRNRRARSRHPAYRLRNATARRQVRIRRWIPRLQRHRRRTQASRSRRNRDPQRVAIPRSRLDHQAAQIHPPPAVDRQSSARARRRDPRRLRQRRCHQQRPDRLDRERRKSPRSRSSRQGRLPRQGKRRSAGQGHGRASGLADLREQPSLRAAVPEADDGHGNAKRRCSPQPLAIEPHQVSREASVYAVFAIE